MSDVIKKATRDSYGAALVEMCIRDSHPLGLVDIDRLHRLDKVLVGVGLCVNIPVSYTHLAG